MQTSQPNPRVIPDSIADVCRECGRRFGVVSDVHSDDYIFWFSFDMPANTNKEQVVKDYFESGEVTAASLRRQLSEYRSVDTPFSLLEFAAGYGRVTRHLKNALPAARVVACDIHAAAVPFLSAMGVEGTLSSVVPEQMQIGQKFDVIYALSFFTHMPKRTWGRWLSELANRLATGGILIFTTHGESALSRLGAPALGSDGFWFTAFSEQKDLSTVDYGATATSFDFVNRHIGANDLRLLRYADCGMGYQDLYVAQKR
jgi:SAM-dependent methyltransferase